MTDNPTPRYATEPPEASPVEITQNSPACATQRAAAAQSGFAGTPLTQTPTAALAFALGYVVTQPIRAEQFGGFCALVEELQTRFVPRPGSQIPRTALGEVIEALPPDLARKIEVLYNMQRGQRWSHTGQPNAHGQGPQA